MKMDDIKPTLYTIGYTERLVADQGYAYNDVRLTYNSDVYYGGLYGNEGKKPQVEVSDTKPL
jgi:hypothetical protein